MKTIYKRVLAAGITFIWVLIIAWLGGFNFDVRDGTAVCVFLAATVLPAYAAWFQFD